MKQAIVFDIISADISSLEQVRTLIPASEENSVWEDQYEVSDIHPDMFEDEIYHLNGEIRLHIDTDQAAVAEIIIQGVLDYLASFELGTYVKLHECPHDDLEYTWPDGSRGCKETILYILDDSQALRTIEHNSPVKVRIEKDTGKVKHYDKNTEVETEVDELPPQATAAQVKVRMEEKGLRIR